MKNPFTLTERNFDVINWGGVAVELNLSFDNILMMLQMFDDSSIREKQKPHTALQMLIVEATLIPQLDISRRLELLRAIFMAKLGVDLDGDTKNTQKKSEQLDDYNADETAPDYPIVDYSIDAERIYASFLMDYSIDLIEEQGKLKWSQFQALFNNLSDNTPMKIAIKYRVCAIPERTKDNKEEVKDIRKKKLFYELPKAKEMREAHEYEVYKRNMDIKRKRIMEMQSRQ